VGWTARGTTAQAATSDAEARLQAFLKQQRAALSCPAAKFVNLNKDVYLLEVGAPGLGLKVRANG